MLKERLESDLREAMKARDELVTSTLRMAITAVRNAEVAGKAARELSDEEILSVLTKEAKKRREAAEAFAGAGREAMKAAQAAVAGRAEGGRVAAEVRAQLAKS